MKTFSSVLTGVEGFFRVGVAAKDEPVTRSGASSSKVTTFSQRVLAAIVGVALQVIAGDLEIGGVIAVSCTAAAKLNSLTLRGTKYSKCSPAL